MKNNLDGKTFFPLTVQDRIIEIREDIEKGVVHAGTNFELIKQAYNEIKVAHGGTSVNHKSSCSGCTQEMNKIVGNWLKLYDELGPSEKRILRKPKVNLLKPVSDGVEPSYKELLEKFNNTATQEEKQSILQGRKTPKKEELINYFNGK